MNTLTPAASSNPANQTAGPTALNTGTGRRGLSWFSFSRSGRGKSRMDPTRNNTAAGMKGVSSTCNDGAHIGGV